jgi:hypothetical protein
MSYLLLNIEKNTGYIVEDELWITVIKAAKDNYWEPEGTLYNFELNLDEYIDDCDDQMHIVFSTILANNEYYSWDGNYIEKKGQIVSESDSYQLFESLIESGLDNNLVEFIGLGSFLICSMN